METVEERLRRMSLEEKVGQMMMVGFHGVEPSRDIEEMISDCHLGGVILFARNIENPEQTARLNQRLQEMAVQAHGGGIPLFISTDQEGGTVVRLAEGAAVSPGNMALGATRSERLTHQVAAVTARELKAVGVNVNLAPCVDVNNNPRNPVIGLRSFGEDPDLVARLGAAAVRGCQENGVVAVAKHFPGHGDTDTDSHLALPLVGHDRERLFAVELKPFRAAIAAGVDAIMTAHVVFPAFEPDRSVPATLSHGVLTRLLRKELGFKGLIMTDCMEMKAIADNFGSAEAAVRTVEAGADMVLISHTLATQRAAYEGLMEAVKSRRLSEERIEASVRRILSVKEKYGLLAPASIDVTALKNTVGTPQSLSVMDETAQTAVTLAQNDDILPLSPNYRVLIVDEVARARTVAEDTALAVSTVGTHLAGAMEKADILMVDIKPTEEQVTQAVSRARDVDVIVVATQDAHRWSGQVKLVKSLLATGKPVVVMGLRTPYDLECFPEVSAYVACYGYRDNLIKAGVNVITGKLKPVGKLPVTIPGVYGFGHGLEMGG